MTEIKYQGMESRVYEQGEVKIIVAKAVGPRILFLGFREGENLFAELSEVEMKTALGPWKLYGGHRLWHAPEVMPRTYAPDNEPVAITERGSRIVVEGKPEKGTGIVKRLEIEFISKNSLKVYHYLKNINLWEIELAAWALSVMVPGGMAIIPQNKKLNGPDHLLPNRLVVLWPYTKIDDKRLRLGDEYVILRQDSTMTSPIKIGIKATAGWCAYYQGKELFIKRFKFFDEKTYPDFGVTVESYTNDKMIELETVGPLRRLKPGEELEHIEEWELVKGIDSLEEGKLKNILTERGGLV
jgi:hypothetical protein